MRKTSLSQGGGLASVTENLNNISQEDGVHVFFERGIVTEADTGNRNDQWANIATLTDMA